MFIAVDIGGTRIRVAGVDDLNQPILSSVEIFENTNDYKQDLLRLKSAICRFKRKPLEGIGLGIPAVLSLDRLTILHYVNLPDWDNQALIADLEKEFNCPVRFENDAAAAALGEAFYGHGMGRSSLHITWGTGIGGAAVERRDDKVFLSPFEPGHQILDIYIKQSCNCGQKGCLEYFCGGGEVKKRLGKRITELSSDEWNEVLTRFAQGMVNLLAIRPVDLITIGGGIADKRPDDIKKIAALVQKHLKIVPMPEIRLSKLGEEGGLFGALALFRL